MQVLDDQLELIYSSFVRTQDVVYKTCPKRGMIERYGRKFVLETRQDDDDDNDDD